MVEVQEGERLQTLVNKLLLQAAQGKELKDVEAAADGLIQLGAETLGDKEALECLARESLGYSISRKEPAIGQRLMVELKNGELFKHDGIVNTALTAIKSREPEIARLMGKYGVGEFDVKIGVLKISGLQGILNDITASVAQYSRSNQSTQNWLQNVSGKYVLVDKLLGDIAKLGVANDEDRLGRGLQQGRAYPQILNATYETVARLALSALRKISYNRNNDDCQRELLKDDVNEGIEVLEGIANKYSGKTGNKKFIAKVNKRINDVRKIGNVLRQRRLPEILNAQDTLYNAAKEAAEAGNEEAFKRAKTLYAVFTQAYATALEEDQGSFNQSIKALNDLYQEK